MRFLVINTTMPKWIFIKERVRQERFPNQLWSPLNNVYKKYGESPYTDVNVHAINMISESFNLLVSKLGM